MDTTRFQRYLEEAEAAIAVLERRSGRLGNAKLALVAALLAAAWFFYRSHFATPQGLVAAVVLAVNLWFFMWHGSVSQQIREKQGLADIIRRYLARINGTWTAFEDEGTPFIDPAHPYTYDLDIFGPASLFQYLNIAHTSYGRQAFAGWLKGRQPGGQLAERQQAIAELAGMDDFAFQAEFLSQKTLKNKKPVPELVEKLATLPDFLSSRYATILFRLLPVGLWAFILFAKGIFALAVLAILAVPLVVLLVKANGYLGITGKAKYGFDSYSQYFALVEEQDFTNPLLAGLRQTMVGEGHSATKATKQLDSLLQRIEARNNFILYILLNGLFLWDINNALSLQRWKNQYKNHLDEWFNALGEMESLLCFSVLRRVEDHLCTPVASPQKGLLAATGVGHPLIPAKKRVCNNFTLVQKTNIISGSNMSGKTTFMRTLALNIVLAGCGAPVCASSFQHSHWAPITSMRIVDDLHAGVSTFYAELTRIKTILDTAENNPDTLFFIDEIFRGTNSSDRTGGAKAVIDQLQQAGAYGFLTTHDLALCSLADGPETVNWHFSEQLAEGQLHFDYTIKPGITSTSNGRYLMQMMGIMPG